MPRILIVEDSPTQTEQLRLTLQAEGFDVETAHDGRSGLERLHAASFDLVLSDVLMPELSGYELCRQIKTDPQTCRTPVVLLTQLTDPLDVLHGLACGADNFITKPYDVNYLVRRLRSILANGARRAAGLPDPGTVINFRGTGVTITTDKEQILDLLLATVEEAVRAQAREKEALSAREQMENQAAALLESGRRKDHHLAVLAHELRNPMAPLLTSLHVLRQPAADGAARQQALDRMERQLRVLNRLLDDLLDASQLAQGQVRLRPERLDLGRLVATAAEDRRAVLEEAGLTLTVHVPQTPAWHRGDATRLVQVLHNLLENAGRYTGRGGRVSVGLEADAGRGQAVLTVTDTGVGIADDVLPRLFQPFAQAAQGVERPRGGLGLGLSVVKGLVDLHGGEVAAASAGPGRGATFTVRLPTQREPEALTTPPRSASAASRKLRVLVVEDNKDAADSLRAFLTLLGHDVRVAYTGTEGVQTAIDFVPAAVISDIGLPGLDGYGVARQLRQQPDLKSALLIAVTGYGGEEEQRQGIAAGFDHYLVKPVDPEQLQQVLRSRIAL